MLAEWTRRVLLTIALLAVISAIMPQLGLSAWLPLLVVGGLIALVVVFVLPMAYCIYREHVTTPHQHY